jgi:hypothetical protein
MEQGYTFDQYTAEVQSRVATLTDEEKQTLSGLAESPAGDILIKILGEELLSSVADVPAPTQPEMAPTTGLASPIVATPTPTAAPVAAERTGLAARPMQ